MVLFLLLTGQLTFYLLYTKGSKLAFSSADRIIESLLFTALIVSLQCWVYAEVFSILNALHSTSAKIYWTLIVAILLGLTIRNFQFSHLRQLWFECQTILHKAVQQLTKIEKGILLVISLFFLLPLLYLAISVPPNNYDSHHYHLHRLMAWTYFQNLDHYPTEHLQQLYHNVFSEYLLLNIYLLDNESDHWLNMVQYVAGVGSFIAIRQLAAMAGLTPKGQFLAVVLLVTLPILLFEMTTTQVDLLATFYFLTFLYFGFKLTQQYTFRYVVATALALAFAAFTKYPTVLFALPFCAYFAGRYVTRFTFKQTVFTSSVIIGVGVLTFLPFLSRNYALFAHPLSPSANSEFFAERIPASDYHWRYTLCTLVKNASLHASLPNSTYNQQINTLVSNIHQYSGVLINQPETSLDDFQVRFNAHEDMVPNTLHFLLLCVCGILVFYLKPFKRLHIVWILALIGMLLFCTAFKFQLWHTRTHMPFFAMGCLVIASVLQRAKPLVQMLVIGAAIGVGSYFVWSNPSKPLLSLNYLLKRSLAYLPPDVCPKDSTEKRLYQQSLAAYYDFETEASCYKLQRAYSYATRRMILDSLQKVGFYKNASSTILTMPKHAAYYRNMQGRYQDIWPLVPYLKTSEQVIGFITHRADGAYFYQAITKDLLHQPAKFAYIYCKKGFRNTKNYTLPSAYQTILTDHAPLVQSLIPDSAIASIVPSTNGMAVIRLHQPSKQMYTH